MAELVKIEGLRELDEALAALPRAFRRPVVLRALNKAAQPIVRDARAQARRGSDPRRRGSKKMRRSGKSIAIGPGADSIRARAVRELAAGSVEVRVGPDAAHFYMRFLEFGTARQAPRRFLTPAFDANREAVIVAFASELWGALQGQVASLARRANAGTLSAKATSALLRQGSGNL